MQDDRKLEARGAGTTLIETVVTIAILAGVMVPVGFVMLQSSRAFSSVANRSHVVNRGPIILDRIVEEVSYSRLLSPAVPAGSTFLRVDRVTEIVDGVPVYGDPVQIDLVPMESSNTDGVDNDDDGVVDESGLRIWTDFQPHGTEPGADDEIVLLGGSIVRDGLRFTLQGSTVVIEVTFVDVPTVGETPVPVYISTGAFVQQ